MPIIAVAGFDNHVDDAEFEGFITTFEIDAKRMIQTTLAIIRQKIEDESFAIGKIIIRGKLIE